jgi:hypothetical protein
MKAMYKLRTELWDDSEKDTLRIGVIKHVAPCDYKPETCTKPARIQVQVRNGLGTPIWHRDYCHEHAAPVLEKAKAVGFRIIED